MDSRAQALRAGVSDHLAELGMQQRLPSVEKVELVNDPGCLVCKLAKKVEIHEPALLVGKQPVAAERAPQVAVAGCLNPYAGRRIAAYLSFPAVRSVCGGQLA